MKSTQKHTSLKVENPTQIPTYPLYLAGTPSKNVNSECARTRSPNSLNLRTTETHGSIDSRDKKSEIEKLEFVERVQQEMARLTPMRTHNAPKSETAYLNVPNSNFLQREGIATFQPNSPSRGESEKNEESPNIMLHWPFSPATILKRKELSVPRVNRGMLNDDLSPILNLVSFHSPNLGPQARSQHQSDDCLTPRRLFDQCYNASLSPRTNHGLYNRPFYPLSKSGNTELTQLSPPHQDIYQSRKNYTDYTRTSATNRQNRMSGYSAGQTTPFTLSDSQFQTKGDRIIRKRKRKTIEQLKMLQEEYEKNPTWSKMTMLEVAQKTGLSQAQVYKWGWDQKRKKLGVDYISEENGVGFPSQLNYLQDEDIESSESDEQVMQPVLSRLLKPRKAEQAELISKVAEAEGLKGRKSKRLLGEEASFDSQEDSKRRKSTRSKAKSFKL